MSDSAPDPIPNEPVNPVNFAPVARVDGITATERYLQRLCERSFLRLWSYPGVYRDQGGGKEVADLLVVFGDEILLFSDKSCAYPSTGDAQRDWRRWYERAILRSSQQTWGAERWIRDHPNRLFLDRACQVPFPIQIPSRDRANFHRIVVAHGVADRCRAALGGSGSLMFAPTLASQAPFTIGDIDPRRGFVHVLDDHTLEVVLEQLDTVSDFIAYLRAKEALVRSGQLAMSPGEEELLGLFLTNGDATGHHFPPLDDGAVMFVEEGHWKGFVHGPLRRAQREANAVSYAWDDLIAEFERHFLAGTSAFRTHGDVRELEPILRHMAAENRTTRRYLATKLLEVIQRPVSRGRPANATVAAVENGTRPAYVFVAMDRSAMDFDKYRERRRALLENYVFVTAYLLRQFRVVIGIATEPMTIKGTLRSEDAYLLEVGEWTPEMEEQGRQLHEDVGLFRERRQFSQRVVEYPVVRAATDAHSTRTPRHRGRARNVACPCGSGKKHKRCCGR